jgi:hypothetical protein
LRAREEFSRAGAAIQRRPWRFENGKNKISVPFFAAFFGVDAMIGTEGRHQKGRTKTKRNSERNAPESPIIRIHNDPTITAKGNLAMAKLMLPTRATVPGRQDADPTLAGGTTRLERDCASEASRSNMAK